MDEINTKPLILNDILDWVDRCAEPTHIYCYHRCVVCHCTWLATSYERHELWCWVPRLRAAIAHQDVCTLCHQPLNRERHHLGAGMQCCGECCPLCNSEANGER